MAPLVQRQRDVKRVECARRANQRRPLGSFCPAPFAKIFGFRRRANQIYHSRRPAPNEGRCATSRNVEQDAVDADVLADEQHGSGRRSRVVLTPRCWRQVARGFSRTTVTKSPITGESAI